jgi:flagellar hook-associated protein 2
MAFNITGLSSQLDWGTMITQLVALERKPITALETNKTALSARKSAWSEVNTKLLSLKTAATALSARNDFDVFKPSATVSGTSKAVGDLVSFATGSNAAEGTYSIKVNHLAIAQKYASTNFDSTSAALGISGTLTINDHELSISTADTLADIRSKINALNTGEDPIGVTASIIGVSDSEYRLTLTSNVTGAEGMTMTDGTGSLGLTQVAAGQDAEIVVDGFTITRSSNTITDVISGVTLNLVGEDEGATVTLNINRDYEGIKEKIKTFVDAYNGLMTFIAEQGTASDDGKTTKPLFADSSLRSVKTTLRSVILSEVSGLDSTINRLSAIGISIEKTGQLSIDDDTLDGYLKTNFNDVVNLFTAQGSSSNSDLTFVYSGTGTVAGNYEVEITQLATKAGTTGSGFSGTLGEETTLTLTSASGREATITLSAGANMDAIVEAINDGNTLGITAENVGGQLSLASGSYGTPGNFEVSVAGGDIGLADGTYAGVDVAGRIRAEGADEWMTMTGKGQTLTGDDDQDVDGLVIRYAGTGTGTFDFTFIQGVGEQIDQALYSMTDSIDGYVATKQKSLQSQMDKIDKKISNMEVRLTRYQATLTAKYSAMEAMLNTLQSQQSWLTSQISSLPSSTASK